METAQVRIRPFRFAFLVEPKDKKSLLRTFEVTSSLWGGSFNFIVPLFKTVPERYKQQYQKPISAKTMLNGFVEAFQPDYIVESRDGQCKEYGIDFPEKRTTSFTELLSRDELGRCQIGVDLRSVCHDLYEERFQFVQRHPPEVIIPSCKDKRFDLLFAAMFGSLPEKGELADASRIYIDALDGKRKVYESTEYPEIFQKTLFPIRVTRHKLETYRNSFGWDSHLFYMDEGSPWDLIEYWNYRALGWKIIPFPARLAPQLKDFAEKFIADNHRPFPPPSNAWHATSLLCAKSQSFDELRAFVSTLKVPTDNHPLSIDPRVPRIWEEWGRGADHATPQTVTHAQRETNAYVIGNGLHVNFQPHEFADDDPYCSRYLTSANVIESIGSNTPVIPWNRNVAAKLTYNFGQEKTWISREGIVTFGGTYSGGEHLRMPSPINIFSSLAEASGLQLTLSPAGRVCEQIISSFGNLMSTRTVLESRELMRMLDRMAHEDLEVEIDEPGQEQSDATKKRKKVKKAYAPLGEVQRVLRLSHQSDSGRLDRQLAALTRCNVLRLGMALQCDSCQHSSWFSLEDVKLKLHCPRCLTDFSFPAGVPPGNAWAYRVLGPFATANFAHGAYCVASAMHFIEDKIAHKVTMISSFEMKKNGQQEFESDFGAFISPGALNPITSPYLMLGECKSFNRFEEKDFERARKAAQLFPGAVLCFCTFNESLEPAEIKGLKKIVEAGRDSLDVGKHLNPVLILTGRELFGQFHFGEYSELYGTDAQLARGMFMRGEIRDMCEFTQRLYLGMPSSHDVRQEKYRKQAARKAARNAKKTAHLA
jgi:hypothetical protein